MTPRTWSLAVLLVAAALAGCTGDSATPPVSSPAPDAGARDAPGSAPSSGAGSAPVAAPPARPAVQPVTDAGTIQGPFEKAWAIEVPVVGARGMTLEFAMTGIEPGAPVTARVNFLLLDPSGTPIKAGAAGLGGEGDTLRWTLQGTELALPGTYTLEAVSSAPEQAPLGIPSAGLAKYQLYALVEY